MKDYRYLDDLFLLNFPGGREDEMFIAGGKKHKSSDKIIDIIRDDVDIESFTLEDTYHINNNIRMITKLVSMSSMISVFEKVAFKNYLSDARIHEPFLKSLYELLKDNNEDTFNNFVYTLNLRKDELNKRVATWPLITFFLLYFNPKDEVFIKPSTIKKVAKLLETDIQYVSYPNYDTYLRVKEMVNRYKEQSKLLNEGDDNIMVQALMYCALEI